MFSGIEAASVAWHDFDWECVGVSEIEPFPCAVLKHHYPNVPNLGDITKISEETLNELIEKHEHIDIVVGGSPCQAFSTLGLRKGLTDPRGQLMFEYCRVVRTLRPTYFIWENVVGALSSGGGEDFGALLTEMADIGYSLCWRVLDAMHFGVPQRRRRVFLVGCLGKNTSGFKVLFEPEGMQRDFKTSKRKGNRDIPNTQKGDDSSSQQVRYLLESETAGTLVARDSKQNLNGEDIVGKYVKGIVVETDEGLKVRRLTMKESERLQGFPDDYTKIPYKGKSRENCPHSVRYKALGNSMAVPVMRYIGIGIREVENRTWGTRT